MKGVNHVVYTGNVGSRFEDVDLMSGEKRFTFDVCCDRREDKIWMTVNVYQHASIEFLRNRFRAGDLTQGSYVLVEGSVMKWKRGHAIRSETVILLSKQRA